MKIFSYKAISIFALLLILTSVKVVHSSEDELFLLCSNHNAELDLPFLLFRVEVEDERHTVNGQYFSFTEEEFPNLSNVQVVEEAVVRYVDDFVISISDRSERFPGIGWMIDRESGYAIFVPYAPFASHFISNRVQRMQYFLDNIYRMYHCRSVSQTLWDIRYEKAIEVVRERKMEREAAERQRLEEQTRQRERRLGERLF